MLTHFPPNDNYCAGLTPSELLFSEKNHADKGRCHDVMMLFGHGDGGGGPTNEMLDRMQMLNNVPGLPRVKARSTPSDFFKKLVYSSILHERHVCC